ncbi:MAG: carbamate kinase [Candidatus Aenigmatarchaeota archaeon]
MAKTAVVALGGNALIRPGQKGTFKEQMGNVERAVQDIGALRKKGYRVLVTHGNGPQVGNLLLQQDAARAIPKMPLFVCVAESQAQIGYMIEKAVRNRLGEPSAVVVTHMVVDKKDPAFKRPTKPIGPYYPTAKLPPDWHIVRSVRGYRRVVASPKPKEVLEAEEIKALLPKTIVVAGGGGGVPLARGKGGALKGIAAVIDKDWGAQLLAKVVGAELLVILTDIEQVFLNYNQPEQAPLGKVSAREARKHLKEGHFLEGSMGPKIEASLEFLKQGGKRVVITSFGVLERALEGEAGTVIEK